MYVFTIVLNDHYCEIIIFPAHDLATYLWKYAVNCDIHWQALLVTTTAESCLCPFCVYCFEIVMLFIIFVIMILVCDLNMLFD